MTVMYMLKSAIKTLYLGNSVTFSFVFLHYCKAVDVESMCVFPVYFNLCCSESRARMTEPI